jgi:hypothetical protein
MSFVEEWVQAAGRFRIDLSPNTPQTVLDALTEWDHLVVTDQRVDPARHNDAALKSLSRFSGVLLRTPTAGAEGLSVAGFGVGLHLGDVDGIGDIHETEVSLTADTFANWIRALLPPGGSIVEGVFNSVTGTLTAAIQYLTPREAIDAVCSLFSPANPTPCEWRVNPDGTLDAGRQAQLYITAPESETLPPVLVFDAPGAGGVKPVPVQALRGGKDDTLRVLRQVVFAEGEAETLIVGDADATHTLKDFHGNALQRTRVTSDVDISEANAATRAQALLDADSETKEYWELDTRDFHIQGEFRLGDTVLVYDPDHGFTDLTIDVQYAGEHLSPRRIRVVGWSWRITDGMGVYHRSSAGVWTDLTDYLTLEPASDHLWLGTKPVAFTESIDGEFKKTRFKTSDQVPNPPTSPAGTGSVYLNKRGREKGRITPSWVNPTQNTDGSTLTDLTVIKARWRIQGSADNWEKTDFEPDDTDPSIGGLDIDTTYDLGFRAVRRNGNKSAWSSTATVVVSADTIAPATPPTPTIVRKPGGRLVLSVNLSSGGYGAANLDIKRFRVFAGLSPAPTTKVDVIDVSYEELAAGDTVKVRSAPDAADYGVTLFFRVRAVDHAGNVSGYSADASLSPLAVQSAELGDSAVDERVLADGSVKTAKIADTQVTPIKTNVSQLSAVAADLGSITAGTITGATIQTSTSGSRVRLVGGADQDIIQFFSPTGTLADGVIRSPSELLLQFRVRDSQPAGSLVSVLQLGPASVSALVPLLIDDGVLSAPGLAFAADPDTGIGQVSGGAGNNWLSIITGTSERVRVTNTPTGQDAALVHIINDTSITGQTVRHLRLNYANAGNADSSLFGIFFDATTGNTAAKAAIVADRQASFGRSDLVILLDNVADDNDAAIVDEVARFLRDGTMTIGGNLVLHAGTHISSAHNGFDHTGHTLANITGHTLTPHDGMNHTGHAGGTTASAADLREFSTRQWIRSTSVLAIKENIWPVLATDALPSYITARAVASEPWVNPILDLVPVGFDSIPDAERGRTNPFIGLVAEQVEEVFPWAAAHHQDEKGDWVLDGWDTGIVLSALLAKSKEKFADIETRLAALEAV